MAAGICNRSSVPSFEIVPESLSALGLLLEEFDAAHDEGCSVWKFTVKQRRLSRFGMSETLFCFLHEQAFIERHGEDVVLTLRGGDWLREVPLVSTGGLDATVILVARAGTLMRDVPFFHAEDRKLWFRGVLVKHFTQPANNQVTVLLAFQEAGWVHVIDDPLPGVKEKSRWQRMRDTINGLNDKQAGGRQHLHFGGTGTGQHIRWYPGKDA